jgi:hypothetical protein
MSLFRRLVGPRMFQKVVGVMAAEYFRLLWKTTRFVMESEDLYERAERDPPIIIGVRHRPRGGLAHG